MATGRVRQAGRRAYLLGLRMTQCETIAIVDDDVAVCEAVARTLAAYGHRTEQYSSAEEFLRAAKTTKASRLVIDINLGDITGVELARQLSAMGVKLPIIFVTGSRDDSIRKHALDFGCVAYLHKPFLAADLIAAIAKATG